MRISARGEATADQVWQRYLDPQCWPGWSPQIAHAELDDGAPRLTRGATGSVRSYVGPALAFTVTELTDDHWSWKVGLGPVRVGMTHGVDPDGSTWIEMPLLLAGYAPLARVALGRLVRR